MEDAIRIIEGLDTSNSEENIKAKKMAVAAMKKQIPKRPVTYTSTNRADCPVCGETVRGIDKPYGKYCSGCGQKLDWSDEQRKEVQTHAGVLRKSSRTKKNIMLIWQNIRRIGRQVRSFIGRHTRQES